MGQSNLPHFLRKKMIPDMDMLDCLAAIKDGTKKKIILDTDTYNEVDDQFALAYAMLSPEKIELLSVNAAPFLNSRSVSPADGMEQSYNEIFKIMNLTDPELAKQIPVYRGSERFMTSKTDYVPSGACDNIIRTVMNSAEPVYIVAIGAITNVASALVKCPEIAQKAVLIWLGGHALNWPDTREFNLKQDIPGAQAVFDSGIALYQIPCSGVCSQFLTSVPELEYYLRGKNDLCDYLCDIVRSYPKDSFAWSKVIWDVTAIGAITVPKAEDAVVLPRPIVTGDCRYAFDGARAPYMYVRYIHRDPLYADLFRKLSNRK